MNKALKKLAMAILAAGATVAATKALAAVQTNTQVLDNISVQLKVYSQGALGRSDKTLVVTPTTLTTSDIIQQLDIISGFKANPRTSKLVSSTLYSNVLTGTPNTVVSNNLSTNNITGGPTATNIYVEFTGGGTNSVPITSGINTGGGGYTNGFIISNNSFSFIVYNGSGVPTATNAPIVTITNDVVYDVDSGLAILPGGTAVPGAGGTATTFTNGAIRNNAPNTQPYSLGYWVVATPVITTSSTNVIITQYSPVATNVFTNVPPVQYCIMTSKSGGTFDLYDVSDWININNYSPIIYKETGTHLTETNFLGTNIAAQTAYSRMDVSIAIVYGTNGTVTGQTNLYLDPLGLATSTGKIINLVKGGTAADKQDFSVFYKTTIDGTCTANIGGSFTADGGPVYTNSVTGVTNTPTFNPGEYLFFFDGTFQTNNYDVPQTNTISATPALVNGTITLTYLSQGVEVVPTEP